jgi:hypothetical protein
MPTSGGALPEERRLRSSITRSTPFISCSVSNAAGSVGEKSGGSSARSPLSNSRSNFAAKEPSLCSNWPDSRRRSPLAPDEDVVLLRRSRDGETV